MTTINSSSSAFCAALYRLADLAAYPAIALTTDTSLLTAAKNDLGFDQTL